MQLHEPTDKLTHLERTNFIWLEGIVINFGSFCFRRRCRRVSWGAGHEIERSHRPPPYHPQLGPICRVNCWASALCFGLIRRLSFEPFFFLLCDGLSLEVTGIHTTCHEINDGPRRQQRERRRRCCRRSSPARGRRDSTPLDGPAAAGRQAEAH